MLAYQLRIAIKSLKRTPILSALLVAGIALGIAVSTAFVTAFTIVAGNPIPQKSDQLFHVQIDSWGPGEGDAWDDERPDEPPDQITWRDAQALLESDIPTHATAMFTGAFTVFPETKDERPFRAEVRLTRRDFFPMFDVPFQYGGPWSEEADRDAAPVVVLDDATNLKLFGGENSVGRRVRMEDREMTVVGVLAPWNPSPKFFDVTQGAYDEPEPLFAPLSLGPAMEIQTTGNTSNWKFYNAETYADFLEADVIFMQMWVQLDTPEQQRAFDELLTGYVAEQKQLGRLPRPDNHRLRPVMEWMAVEEVVPDSARTMLIVSLLFLVVCSVNLIGILLGKFLAHAPEVGVRRALGASKRSVFVQHLVECEVIALAGGLVGIVGSLGILVLVNRLLIGEGQSFSLNLPMVGVGILLALAAGLVAGVYPSWRICRVPAASYLKQQ